MADQHHHDHGMQPDDLTRVIMLVYGMLDGGKPCWVYVAVKPSKYDDFIAAHKDGSLDLYDFKEFGEIIVSGEGKRPPDDITLKVAEMYQTDPTTIFQPIDVEQEIAKRMEEIKNSQKDKKNK
ncbi:MAG: hypothetical protein AB7L92_05150 [Alphaproteobacteria bacterium]